MTDGTSGEGIFPVVVIKINGITCRALIDSGAGSSYASVNLISTLKIKPSEVMRQQIDMMMTSRTTNIEFYDVKVSSSDGSNEISTRLSKIDKGELLLVNNPQYGDLIKRYQHLNPVRMIDTDTKSQLPIHVILGSGDYARINTPTKPLIGRDGEPVAEKTKFGWTILSPGVEFDRKKMMLTQASQVDFDQLCRLDVLGLADSSENDQSSVHTEFREQLERNPSGWYETGLPWKPNHPPLPTNEMGSRRRLENLVKRLKSNDRYHDYDAIIQQQLDEGVIEVAPVEATGTEFYIPHKAVVKNSAQSTKLRIVYDASAKIQEHNHVKWHHVSTHENPADLGSRGGKVVGDERWKYGPHWLKDQSQWPPQTTLRASPEAKEELKAVMSSRALVTVNPPADRDTFSNLLEKLPLRKVLRICAWISRFHGNCRATQRERQFGPLTTAEIRVRELWWIRKTQIEAAESPEFDKTKVHLNIQPNLDGILECRGRIDGEYPVFLPSASIFTRKVVERAHLSTLHGGVSMTMAKVRERYWVPKLRRLVKHVRSKCYGCLKFRAGAYEKPPPGKLPSTRTQGTTPFQVVGVDFAGPIRYVTRNKAERKAYLLLYGCSLTRAVHLEVLKSIETSEFITSLKRFIARRGRPKLIYSDNAKTFKSAAKWLGKVQQEETFHAFLADNAVEWRFNLSRAPWWGGQYERLIGLFKRAFHKTIGNGTLTWEELEEVVLDVEVTLNNRPLNYLEDDVEFSVLTPSSMLNVNPYLMPEMKPHQIEEMDLRKRAKFLHKCKQAVWKRWAREYVRGLRERHRQEIGKQASHRKIGEVVIAWDEDRNRNKWKLGIVSELIEGKDNIIRGAQVRTANGKLERAIQHLYPLELSCDKPKWKPNPSAPTYTPRSQRDAAAAAKVRLQQQAEGEEQ